MLDNKTGGAGRDPAADAGIATETGRGHIHGGVFDCYGMNLKGSSINNVCCIERRGGGVEGYPPKTIY